MIKEKEIVQVIISKERYDELINKEVLADNNTFTLHLNHSAFMDMQGKNPKYPVTRLERGTQFIGTFKHDQATFVAKKIMNIIEWNKENTNFKLD